MQSYPFGWEPDQDGFRGHVFANEDNSTVVLSIKGTSAGIVGAGGPTSKKDKLNDNLLWSCCCARVDWSWSTVCGCYSGANKCDQNCLEDALVEESLFYPIGTNLYNNISYMYPHSQIWLTGEYPWLLPHSCTRLKFLPYLRPQSRWRAGCTRRHDIWEPRRRLRISWRQNRCAPSSPSLAGLFSCRSMTPFSYSSFPCSPQLST